MRLRGRRGVRQGTPGRPVTAPRAMRLASRPSSTESTLSDDGQRADGLPPLSVEYHGKGESTALARGLCPPSPGWQRRGRTGTEQDREPVRLHVGTDSKGDREVQQVA